MGVTWSGCYIPSDEQHQTPAGTLERTVASFAGLAEPSSEADETLDGKGKVIFLNPTDAGWRQASIWLFDQEETCPTTIMIEEYGIPQPELDHAGQRFCGVCGSLVRTWAECERCGAEEDPTAWRIGPPLAFFSRSVALSVLVEGGPEFNSLPPSQLDRRLRAFLGGRVEALEAMLRCPLKLVSYVLV